MVQTAYLDHTAVKDRTRLNYKNESHVKNTDEYMTSEDFWKEADKRIVNVCKQYGVL